MDTTFKLRDMYPTYQEAEAGMKDLKPTAPPPITSTYKAIDKIELIQRKTSRFARK